MGKYSGFLKDFMWFALGNIGSKSIVFIMTPLYARYLSQEQYGKMDLVNSTVSLLLPLISLRISLALFRFISDKREDRKEVINNSVIVLIGTILILFAISPLLYQISFLKEFFIYFMVILVLNIIIDLVKSYLKANEQVQVLAVGDIINTFCIAAFNVLFIVYIGKGVDGYFSSVIIAQIVMLLFYLFKGDILKELDIKMDNYKLIKKMILFSIPLIPNSMNFWIMNASDRYMLKYFIGYSAAGVYALANKIPTILVTVNDIFQQSWQITGMKEYSKESKDNEEFNTFIHKNSFALLIICVSVLTIGIKLIMKLFGGSEFYEAWQVVPLLLVSTIFLALSSFIGFAYISSKDTKGAFYTSTIGAVVNIAINFLLIPRIGVQAAALSTLVAYFVIWIIRVFQTEKYLKIKYDWFNIIVSFLIVAVQILILFVFDNNIIIQCLLLLILMYLNRVIFVSIITIIKGIFNKIKGLK